MNRRQLLSASIAVAVAWRPAFGAQNARVGYLDLVRESDGEMLYREFVEGLRGEGYVEGRNLRMERRSAASKPERLGNLAAELGAAKVDVILATSAAAARGAKFGAPRIPTVFVTSADPVVEGLVASLSRPRGYLTGVATQGEDLTAKRLQILKDAFPKIRVVAMVGSKASLSRVRFDEAARQLHLQVLQFEVHQLEDYRDAAAAISRSTADAVLVVEDAEAVTPLRTFAQLMMAPRRPVLFNADVFVEDEGLMAYGVSLRQQYRRAAHFAARLLQGASPSDLAVEFPTRYELVVNLRAADQYAITLPPDFLLRADRIIK